MSKEGHKFNEDNLLRVRKNSRLNQNIFLAKLIMKKHGNVQIEAMGECISLATKSAQLLSKNKFAKISSLQSEHV